MRLLGYQNASEEYWAPTKGDSFQDSGMRKGKCDVIDGLEKRISPKLELGKAGFPELIHDVQASICLPGKRGIIKKSR